jgi:homoserine dehydrogenase
MDKKIKIGLIGLGTVGTGVIKVLKGFDNIEILGVAVRNLNKAREVEIENITDDPMSLVNNPEIDIIVEVVGGCEPALSWLTQAIKNGKHIVTANKELLAKHGAYLFDLAREHNRVILYEAAVAGGIPLIMPIKTTMASNRFDSVAGILNGTTNYILTKMEELDLSYDECLKRAQELGYAETDPTGDVQGYDALYKVATLANIIFRKRIDINKIYREGITRITAEDIKFANELGYKIKLIGLAQRVEEDVIKGIEKDSLDVRVHPMLVRKENIISGINNALNAVLIKGYPIGEVMFTGPGAGEFPTASSVVGDILVLASEINTSENVLPMTRCLHSEKAVQLDISQTENSYYISITAKNTHGTIGLIGTICGKNKINILSVIQKGERNSATAKIIVVTDKCYEQDMQKAVRELENIVCEGEDCIRIDNLIRVME